MKKRWALIPRLIQVENEDGKPVTEAADDQLKDRVRKEQEKLDAKLNALETRSLGRG